MSGCRGNAARARGRVALTLYEAAPAALHHGLPRVGAGTAAAPLSIDSSRTLSIGLYAGCW
ncbi:hypothetical protein [Kumtagia ephedrae]|uniref:hypothetical protein n=1 Tax=Kumtagia ephedrae TaxID=2116701 RepID=UPI0010571CCD|nr:hypothetical protein [Mesorhizobium ephedrae]